MNTINAITDRALYSELMGKFVNKRTEANALYQAIYMNMIGVHFDLS